MAATRTSSDFLMFSSSLPGPSAKRSARVRILRAPAMRSRRASPGQRIMLRTADRCDEFPSPHGFACAEDHIGYQKTITFLDRELRRSLHASGQLPTSALGQKRTFHAHFIRSIRRRGRAATLEVAKRGEPAREWLGRHAAEESNDRYLRPLCAHSERPC